MPGLQDAISPSAFVTAPQASNRFPYGSGIAAFKAPVVPPFAQDPGPAPNQQDQQVVLRFIPPLALFNDASQWVNVLMFNRPLPFNGNPDSNPPLRAQYFTPPPINIKNAAAGNLNLQTQLGSIDIQAAQLSLYSDNYFGS
jgi:hypothetical protein